MPRSPSRTPRTSACGWPRRVGRRPRGSAPWQRGSGAGRQAAGNKLQRAMGGGQRAATAAQRALAGRLSAAGNRRLRAVGSRQCAEYIIPGAEHKAAGSGQRAMKGDGGRAMGDGQLRSEVLNGILNHQLVPQQSQTNM